MALSASLDDTLAGRDFAALLPLELSLSDYHATEKIADLPRKLVITDAPASYTPRTRDITYYGPWGNLAIGYKPFRSSRGLAQRAITSLVRLAWNVPMLTKLGQPRQEVRENSDSYGGPYYDNNEDPI